VLGALRDGLQADLRSWRGAVRHRALHHFTEAAAPRQAARHRSRQGLSISEYGLARLDGGTVAAAGVRRGAVWHARPAAVPPELREDLGELELAAKRALPDLIEERDIRGFVHCHSTWVDGRATLEEMVRAAHALGAEFITITDHTRAAALRERADVDRCAPVGRDRPGCRRSSADRSARSEVDILEDGALDWPSDILDQLEVVICSVHQRSSSTSRARPIASAAP